MHRILLSFSRLSLSASNAVSAVHSTSCRSISVSVATNLYTSPYLQAQPMKKKHRIDPAIERSRFDRKKRKLEKKIRQLEKQSRLFRPVEELMPHFDLQEELSFRSRRKVAVPLEELEQRQLLLKTWCAEVRARIEADVIQLSRAVGAQEKALRELKSVAPTLYEAAIAPYNELLPYTGTGPTVTPPIASYDIPDGNYVDKSKKWIITSAGELI